MDFLKALVFMNMQMVTNILENSQKAWYMEKGNILTEKLEPLLMVCGLMESASMTPRVNVMLLPLSKGKLI